ncbi:MAG: OmpA family protein [Actinomycetota bacterium]|nr:OmpA family protein [Actinomycetota bacterium]
MTRPFHHVPRRRTYLDDVTEPGSARRPARRGLRPGQGRLVYLGAAVVALILIGFAVYLGGEDPRPVRHIVWITEKTTRAPGGMPVLLRNRVLEMAERADGTLTAYAVGSQAHRVGRIDLAVRRDGEREDRPDWRTTAVGHRLDALNDVVAETPVSDEGFSFYSALQLAADEGAKGDDRVEVWLSSTVLAGSIDPLVMSKLTAADPTAAVTELVEEPLRTLDLSRVDLHVIMLTPVGDGQQPLSPASEAWRTSFVVAIAEALGAKIETSPDRSTAAAWPQSSRTPPIRPLPDPTPVVEPSAPTQPGDPVVIDNVAFLPDSATLVDPAAARGAIAVVVTQFNAGVGAIVDITGYCAAFGARDGALRLSAERADTLGDLLVEAGIPRQALRPRGVGFDERADPTADPQSAAQRVVLIRLTRRD